MRRFFTEPENVNRVEKEVKIYEDASHITKVLRMSVGDEILVFDGTGYEYKSRLTRIDKECCVAEILTESISLLEPKVKVTIYQGIPKSGKMEGIIQKSVELGVYEIVPVTTDRCVSKLDGGKKQVEKLKRWNKVAVEAAKQCGRGILPHVAEPLSFSEAVSEMQNSDLAVMPYEMLGHSGVASLRRALQSKAYENVAVLIGPEGGFSDGEVRLAEEKNILMVGLGKRILRTETVSSAVLSAIMYEASEM